MKQQAANAAKSKKGVATKGKSSLNKTVAARKNPLLTEPNRKIASSSMG